jgi:hypothetical protein
MRRSLWPSVAVFTQLQKATERSGAAPGGKDKTGLRPEERGGAQQKPEGEQGDPNDEAEVQESVDEGGAATRHGRDAPVQFVARRVPGA